MAKQTVNIGAAVNDGSGDPARTAFNKLNQNDTELYNFIGGAANTTTLPTALPLAKGGTGATTAAAARTAFGLGTAATANLTTSATDKTTGRVLKVGDFGLGEISPPYYSKVPDLRGFFKVTPAASDDFAHSYGGGVALALAATEVFYLFAPVEPNKPPYYRKVRNLAGGGQEYLPKQTFHTTENTTVDANGFVKAASPIVQLFADKIELNNEARQQNIEFEKLGVGDYLVKGSTGFSQDGWYIETPKDANGNVLVAVVYEQLENGDISIKTYDYMLNNKGRIVADTETPLDIPENRWIDLRLQEIEVTDDTEQ